MFNKFDKKNNLRFFDQFRFDYFELLKCLAARDFTIFFLKNINVGEKS